MSLSEFDLIRKYFNKTLNQSSCVKCGIGDDAAVVSIPAGMDLVLSVDTLIKDVHFPAGTCAEDIGYKALAVNLSDMAAMGAQPHWVTLSLTLPEPDQQWLKGFTKGFFGLAGHYSVELIGGDLSRGPLSITVQIQGLVPAGTAITRAGAQINDLIYVSGTLGDAGLALQSINESQAYPKQDQTYILERLNKPTPRLEIGLGLRGIASSAIDISDGLIADLGHILDASHVGARLDPDLLPLSSAFTDIEMEEAWQIALTSGDDYELCFTIPADKKNELEELKSGVPLTCLGVIVSETGMQWIKNDGNVYTPKRSGYRHF